MRGRYSHAEPGSGTHIRDQTHAGGHELERQQGGTATVLGVVPGVITGVRRVRWPWAAKGTVPERRSSNCRVTTGSKTSVCRVASVVPNSLRPHGLARPAPLSTEILQARILEWAAMPSSRPRDRPDPGIEPASLLSHALAGGFFTTSATWEALKQETTTMKDVSEKAPSDPGAQDGHSRRFQPAIHEQTLSTSMPLFSWSCKHAAFYTRKRNLLNYQKGVWQPLSPPNPHPTHTQHRKTENSVEESVCLFSLWVGEVRAGKVKVKHKN